MHRHRYPHRAVLALAALIVAACGYDGGDPGYGPDSPPPTPAPGQGNTVRLVTTGGARFEPAKLEVPAGTVVTFVWEEGFHDVTSAAPPEFQSAGPSPSPHSFSVTFTETGTYAFFCSVHGDAMSGMRGTITVR